jgi:ubiquinone/menaquinone biosynthesis C-methylase UbiE
MDAEAYKEMIELQEEHWWFVARRDVIQSFIKMQMPQGSGSKVLEIGCGVGGNVGLLSQSGQYRGIDMHKPAIDYCSEKYPQFEFQCTRVEEIPQEFKSNKFDSIYLLDVLEHIDNQVAILKSAQNYLTQSGKILVTVPAFEFLWSPHDEFVHHVRRYTKAGLKRVLKDAGYEVERISYFNSILFPLALTQRLGMRLLNRKLSTHLSTPPAIVNWLFKVIFTQEAWILKRINLPVGLSIIAVVSQKYAA